MRSGQLYGGERSGCARRLCRNVAANQQWRSEISCSDPRAEELMQMPGWSRFLEAIVDYLEMIGVSGAAELIDPFLERGCDALNDPIPFAANSTWVSFMCPENP
eukprot:gnl/TRDRNA2_/TRDRNA2_169387_c2_seq3.p1 gnl/TRDRNA2_/TRDRNA2_169387_c2~~gnl/TRDRNA2_/TRDRNA2_169387_c2_seq3.p1  ORF type:complete len:120 (+),score=3.47 gnl/TRDRNA2_/TRDRNA2_169387_c2_seq3:50-361(+)